LNLSRENDIIGTEGANQPSIIISIASKVEVYFDDGTAR
jgi:hypothetical protein